MTRHDSGRRLPRYAFLPGRHPHPVRDPKGHAHDGAAIAEMTFDESTRWGFDLFQNAYYWEAHEAWEGPWAALPHASPRRALLKGLILLAASGVKLRTGKADAAARHARRASLLLRSVPDTEARDFRRLCGVTPSAIADLADRVASKPEPLDAEAGAPPETASAFASLTKGQ